MQRYKRALAMAVVNTSHTPLGNFYQGAYFALVELYAQLFLRRFSGHIRSLYLRRSCAMGAAVWGLSDIDLYLIIQSETPIQTRIQIQSLFRRLSRRAPLLDSHEEIYSQEQFAHRCRTNPHFAFRAEEGRTTWKLLAGVDVIRALPPLSQPVLLDGMIAEAQMYQQLAKSHEPVDQIADDFGVRRREYFLYKNIGFLFSLNYLVEKGVYLAERPRVVTCLTNPFPEEFNRSELAVLKDFLAFARVTNFSMPFSRSLAVLKELEWSRESYQRRVLKRAMAYREKSL